MTRNERLFKLFRESGEPNFMKFLDSIGENVVIDATEIFKDKVRQDNWWRESLKRQNNIGKSKEEDE